MSKSIFEEMPSSVYVRRVVDFVVKENSKISWIDIYNEEMKLLYDRNKHVATSDTKIPGIVTIDMLTLEDIAIFSIIANKRSFSKWNWYYIYDFGYYVLSLEVFDDEVKRILMEWVYEFFVWRVLSSIYTLSEVIRILGIEIDQQKLYNMLSKLVNDYKNILEVVFSKS